jgi:hypothetical protein
MFFKKLLLSLRMFFFTVIKRNDSKKESSFTQRIGNFDIAIRELISGRASLCSRMNENSILSLAPMITLGPSQKVQLITISGEMLDRNCESNQETIELKVMNFLQELSEAKKRIYFDQFSRFHRERFEGKTINGSNIQFDINTFQLFQGKNSAFMNRVIGKYLEIILNLQINKWWRYWGKKISQIVINYMQVPDFEIVEMKFEAIFNRKKNLMMKKGIKGDVGCHPQVQVGKKRPGRSPNL